MIVMALNLIERNAPVGGGSSDKAGGIQSGENVIDGLARHRTKLFPNVRCHGFRVRVWEAFQDLQHRQTWSSFAQARGRHEVCKIF